MSEKLVNRKVVWVITNKPNEDPVMFTKFYSLVFDTRQQARDYTKRMKYLEDFTTPCKYVLENSVNDVTINWVDLD